MTRKHFRAIAEAVATIPDPDVRRDVAERIASVCRASNTRFSFTTFGMACGVDVDRWTFAGAR